MAISPLIWKYPGSSHTIEQIAIGNIMQLDIPPKVRKNAGWFIAYGVCMAAQIIPLWAFYFWTVDNLYKERAKSQKTATAKEDQSKAARREFLSYIAKEQRALLQVQSVHDPVYTKAASLLKNVNPDILLMLGSTHDNKRDVMLTARQCDHGGACVQCLLLLIDSEPLHSVQLGLGPHPHYEKVEFGTYYGNNHPHTLKPQEVRYLIQKSGGECKITLFDDLLLDEDTWRQGFSDFELHYKPSDALLDKILGEYMRGQMRNVCIKSVQDPDYVKAKHCMPADAMRADVAKALGVPTKLPLVSTKTYVIHTKADIERESRRFESGWYNDQCQYSFYINKYKKEVQQ